jgi:hypothetical protein
MRGKGETLNVPAQETLLRRILLKIESKALILNVPWLAEEVTRDPVIQVVLIGIAFENETNRVSNRNSVTARIGLTVAAGGRLVY